MIILCGHRGDLGTGITSNLLVCRYSEQYTVTHPEILSYNTLYCVRLTSIYIYTQLVPRNKGNCIYSHSVRMIRSNTSSLRRVRVFINIYIYFAFTHFYRIFNRRRWILLYYVCGERTVGQYSE